MIKKFSDAGLNKGILKSIGELGFLETTPVQSMAIPFILSKNKDLVALAHTGTGKTAAFGLPILELTNIENINTQALILSPTRELCMQICDDLRNYSKQLEGIKITAVYGGAGIEGQMKILKKGSHIVVGTPGRTLDLIKRGKLRVSQIKWLVLDEADEMLNMGFQEDLDSILQNTPDEKRTLLFSATMPKGIMRIAERYMKKWEKIAVNTENTGASNVKHLYYVAHARNRFEALKRIVDKEPNIYGIVFCRTRQEAKELADSLMQNGYNADALHGDIPQAQRTVVMNRFKKRQLQLLVATDVAARGVDVNDLTHVINYNLPDDKEIYVHRSGRTGRAGKFGVSVAIVHSRELYKIRDIEKFSSIEFSREWIPVGSEICERQLFNLIDRIENVEIAHEQISKFIPTIVKKLECMSREELIKKMVSVEFNRFLEYYKDAKDLNVYDNKHEQGNKNKGTNNQFAGLKINVGKKHGMDARNLMGLINELTGDNKVPIGRIEINKKESIFEVGIKYKDQVLQAFRTLSEEYPDVVVKNYKTKKASTSKRHTSGYSKKSKGNNAKQNSNYKPTSKQRRQKKKR